MRQILTPLFSLFGIILIVGCVGSGEAQPVPPTGEEILPAITSVQTFFDAEGEPCDNDGKPVVFLFSTTWCGHCKWVGPTFDKVVYEYQTQGKIHAYHYELDTEDDALTAEVEAAVPQEHIDIYQRFNPRGSIPTFIFGCEYYRIGNGYEGKDNGLASEEAEFRYIIEELIQ